MESLKKPPALPAAAFTEHFVRSAGPGGQNVNKVATAVELRFDLNKAGLTDTVRARAERLAGRRLSAGGIIVIHAHEHRTQLKNREAARARLADLLARASKTPHARRATKPTSLARERRLRSKHHHGAIKRERSTRRHGED